MQRPPRSTLFPYTTLFRSPPPPQVAHAGDMANRVIKIVARIRSEEHTSELQSQSNLVCRLLLEKKKHRPDLYPRFPSSYSVGGPLNPHSRYNNNGVPRGVREKLPLEEFFFN